MAMPEQNAKKAGHDHAGEHPADGGHGGVPKPKSPCHRKPQAADACAKRVNDAADAIRLQGKTGRVETPNREGRDKPESQPHG